MTKLWKFGVLVLCMFLLSPYLTFALRIDFDDKKDIEGWELGPQATATVSGGQLELKVGLVFFLEILNGPITKWRSKLEK